MEIEHTKSLNDAIQHLQKLPPTLREEVFHYIDFLRLHKTATASETTEQTVKKRHAGTLKGEAIFSDDFDEPLDDFKDYMP